MGYRCKSHSLQLHHHSRNNTLEPLSINLVERCKLLAINIQHRHDITTTPDGNDNFATRCATTSDMAGEAIYIGNHLRCTLPPRRATHPATIAYASTGDRPLKGSQDQFVTHDAIEARPPESEGAVDESSDVCHNGYLVALVLAEGHDLL